MKRFLLLGFAVCVSTSVAQAQYYNNGYYGGYPSNRDVGGYDSMKNGNAVSVQQTGNRRAQPVYQTYTQTRTYTSSNFPQNYVAYGQPQQNAYQNPMYTQPARTKPFYASVRLGYNQTRGWGSPFKNPDGILLSGNLGYYFPNNLRGDIELAYHTKDAIYNGTFIGSKVDLKYSQYDIGVNGYYDIAIDAPFTPFIGIGAWLVNSKVSGKETGTGISLKASDDEMNLGVSGAVGLSYRLDDMITLEGMMRARYIFCDGHIYNLEALIGARFDF